MIPKIIHYCWLSNNSIPDNLRQCMNSWKEKLHGYEFILWDFKRFDINSSLWVKQAFEAKKYASAADFIRIYAVYHYGGIYLDMDIEVIKSFDDLLNTDIMIAFENSESKGIEAGCFGAEKFNLYLRKILDYYSERQFTLDVIANGYTLPKVMDSILREFQEFAGLSLYSFDYFTAKSFRTGEIKITNNTHCIHHFAGSWVSENEKKYRQWKYSIIQKYGNNVLSKLFVYCIYLKKRIEEDGVFSAILYYLQKIINKKKK